MKQLSLVLLCAIASLCFFDTSSGAKINQVGNCKANLANGQTIDIKPLDNPTKPM